MTRTKSTRFGLVVVLNAIRLLCFGCFYQCFHQFPEMADVFSRAWQNGGGEPSHLAMAFLRVSGWLFGAIALWFIPTWYLRSERKIDGLSRNPSKPWLALRGWEKQHIRNSNRFGVRVLGISFALWALVLAPLLLAVNSKPALWTAAGLFVAWLLMVRAVWRARNWSQAELRFDPLPGLIGGPFNGVVILKETFPSDTTFDVNLRCEATRTSERDSNSTIWSDSQTIDVPLRSTPGTTAIPFSFAIPFKAPSTEFVGKRQVQWLLVAKASKSPIGMQASFEVPVFRTAESSRNYQHDVGLIDKYREAKTPLSILEKYHFQREPLPSGRERLRLHNWDAEIFRALLFVAVLSGLGIAAIVRYISSMEAVIFAAAIPTFFLGGCIYGMYFLWTWECVLEYPTSQQNGNPTTQDSTLTYRVGLFGFARTGSVQSTENCEFVLAQTVHTTTADRWDIALWIHDRARSKLKVVTMLPTGDDAAAVRDYLSAVTGIRSSQSVDRKLATGPQHRR